MPDDLIQSGVPAIMQPTLQPQEADSSQVLVAGAGLVAEQAPAVPAVAEPTELEKLEALIEKLELTTVKEVHAAIGFIRALV